MVGMCANALTRAAETWSRIRPGRHVNQANLLLSAMAELDSFRGLPMSAMLYEIMPALPFGATVIALTALPGAEIYEALAALQEAGRRVLLLTVGRAAPWVPLQIPHHHLGGQNVWQRLQSLELD